MRLFPHSRNSIALAPLLLLASAAAAAPIAAPIAALGAAPRPDAATVPVPAQITGAVHGRFQVVSARATLLDGLVRDASGRRLHRMQAALIGGADEGQLFGRWVELSLDDSQDDLLHLEYDLIGQYTRSDAGVVRFEAQIFLDLTSQGLPVYLHVGEMQGILGRARGSAQGADGIGLVEAAEAVPVPIVRADAPKRTRKTSIAALAAPAPKPPPAARGEFRARYVLR